MARIELTAPRTFWVSPSGSDTGIDGLQSAPFRTPQYAVEAVRGAYDLRGHQIVFDLGGLGPAVYTEGVVLYGPAFIGQAAGTDSIHIRGDVNDAHNCQIITASGDPIATAFGAMFTVQGIKVSSLAGVPSLLQVNQGSYVSVLSPFIFGDAINPTNDLGVFKGNVNFIDGYSVEKSLFQRLATYTQGQTLVYVNDVSQLFVGLGVTGSGWSPGTLVTSIDAVNTTVTVNRPPVTSHSAKTIYFVAGGQTHMDVSDFGNVQYDTNGGAMPFTVDFGWAAYYDSVVHAAELASVKLGANYTGNVAAYKYSVHTNAVLRVYDLVGFAPGSTVPPSSYLTTGGLVL